jgi:Response regulator containing CheY-like receiver, AAA-type ATPase, and DNA-binding domains
MNNEFLNKEEASKDDKSEEYYLYSLEELERKAIEVALKKYNRNITKVSEALGISRNTLYLKMKKYSLE